MNCQKKSPGTLGLLIITFVFAVLVNRADAQSVWNACHPAGFGGDLNLCGAGQPCITELYQDGANIHVGWNGGQNFDLYHVIAGEPGQRVGQAELGGGSQGSYQITNVRPCATFIIKVQGCITHFAAHSDCSAWTETTFHVAPNRPYGLDTCLQGFVWRNAFRGDRVCVTPDVRNQVAADNAQAASRRSPNGGPYGPDTCRQGFVWREASAQDHVCVNPQARSQTAGDNNAKCNRLASCP